METIFLAAGADIKNSFLIARGRRLLAGPRLTDLAGLGPYLKYKAGIFSRLGRRRPTVVACDLHPGYFSTRFARETWQAKGPGFKVRGTKGRAPRLVGVQHHHAHIASVMQEHRLAPPVLGVSFDGTGYGTDGRIWGGEFLLVGRRGFRRLAHLKYWKMPGADRVVAEPWRMVLSILGDAALPFLKGIKKADRDAVQAMLAADIPMPLTSSAGRLFDAAAALLGVCTRASYEAQGPIELERLCREGVAASYAHGVSRQDGALVIDTRPVFAGMCADLKKRVPAAVIAARFHNAMADIIVATVRRLARTAGVRKVALSGGVFANRYLVSRAAQGLQDLKFSVFTNERLPVNDWNIAWGQYYVSGRSR